MIDKRIVLVTGANRGIGLEICRQLSKLDQYQVILTSRDKQKGSLASEELSKEGLKVDYVELDVTDDNDIKECVQLLIEKYGRIDVLINNAGIFPDTADSSATSFPSVFDTTLETMRRGMETNVYGPLLLCQAIIPYMKKNEYGRIVNLSSGMGQLAFMNGGCPSYRVSKTSLNALTRILAEELKDTNIKVNTMCPGWVKTQMGGPNATRELSEGADTAVYLATLPDDGPSGLFFRDRKEFPW